tara:strand:- start:861 stop:1034 length:174 start_codon:yes stop_codon:yes gene_type:complete
MKRLLTLLMVVYLAGCGTLPQNDYKQVWCDELYTHSEATWGPEEVQAAALCAKEDMI